MVDGAQVSLVTLEKALMQYVHEPSSAPFDLNSVPLAAPPEERSAASGGENSPMDLSVVRPNLDSDSGINQNKLNRD